MLPAPSGPGLLIALVVWGLLVVAGLIAIIGAVNQLAGRLLGREAGCLVGGITGLAWMWLLPRIDHLGLAAYTVAFAAGPVVAVGLATFVRRRSGTMARQ